MALRVKLYSLPDDLSDPKYVGPLPANDNDTYAQFREFLEKEGLLDRPFNFWVVEDKCRLPSKFEKFNAIGTEVFVARRSEVKGGPSKRQKIGESLSAILDPAMNVPEPVEFLECDSEDVGPWEPASSSRVGGIDEEPAKTHLTSELVPKEVIEKYQQQEQKLKRELVQISLEDHLWYLKLWDANGVGIVKIHCGECVKDFRGNTGDHHNHAISNLFANFKKHHLTTNAYIRSLCRRQGINYLDHPQSVAPKGKSLVLTAADHKRMVQEGIQIMNKINDSAEEVKGMKPFFLMGDPTAEAL
jgi:hypothetical protein